MTNFKEKKENFKKWVSENKEVLILVGKLAVFGVVIAVPLIAIVANQDKKAAEIIASVEKEKTFDFGRDLVMQFVDPENGEILGSVDCTESFMNDFIDME